MRPYLALTSLLFGLHLGVAAVAALDLPAPVLGLAAFAAGACLGLGLSLLARRLPLPHLLLFALLLNPSAWVAVALLRPEPDPMNLGLFVAIVAFTLLLLGTLLLLLAALLPPWLAPWPLALAGLFLVPLFALLGDALGQALPLWARWGRSSSAPPSRPLASPAGSGARVPHTLDFHRLNGIPSPPTPGPGVGGEGWQGLWTG